MNILEILQHSLSMFTVVADAGFVQENVIGYPTVCYSHLKAMPIWGFGEKRCLKRFKWILAHVFHKYDEASTQMISIKPRTQHHFA